MYRVNTDCPVNLCTCTITGLWCGPHRSHEAAELLRQRRRPARSPGLIPGALVRSTFTRGARLAAVAAVGCLALSACGDKSNGSTADSGNKATGTPILVGFINDDTGPAPFPESTTGAKTAAAYINSH